MKERLIHRQTRRANRAAWRELFRDAWELSWKANIETSRISMDFTSAAGQIGKTDNLLDKLVGALQHLVYC